MSKDNHLAKLTYKTNPDVGLISFFVNGEYITEWSYDDDPEVAFNEFKMIFNLGQRDALTAFANDIESQANAKKPDSGANSLIDALTVSVREYRDQNCVADNAAK